MIELSNTAIITPTDVSSASVEGLAVTLEGKDADGAIKAVCNAVSDIVDIELNRTLHVHSETLYVDGDLWKKARSLTYSHELWLEEWPLVETTETVVVRPSKAGGQLVFSDTLHDTLTGYFGYRRHDQSTVAILNAVSGLSALAVLPALLPGAIRGAACAIALHILSERLSGKFSGESVVQTIGRGSVTITKSNRKFIREQLNKLAQYKHIA